MHIGAHSNTYEIPDCDTDCIACVGTDDHTHACTHRCTHHVAHAFSDWCTNNASIRGAHG